MFEGELDKLINSLINHKVSISHISNADGTLRHTSGVLKKVTDEIITIYCYNMTGDVAKYNLNRKACQLYSVTDEGKVDD